MEQLAAYDRYPWEYNTFILGGDVILIENDLLADALGTIARSRGMSDIAKASGITREALYKALRPNASPRFETISKVCAALGVRLVAQPIHAHS